MMHRRTFLSLVAATTLAGGALRAAASSLAEIESAIASGKPVLIHVTAPWCGTCMVQKPIVAELMAKPEFNGLTKIDVDFDSQRDVLSNFRVQTQATMLVFKDSKEVDRQVGETDPEAIAAIMSKAL